MNVNEFIVDDFIALYKRFEAKWQARASLPSEQLQHEYDCNRTGSFGTEWIIEDWSQWKPKKKVGYDWRDYGIASEAAVRPVESVDLNELFGW